MSAVSTEVTHQHEQIAALARMVKDLAAACDKQESVGAAQSIIAQSETRTVAVQNLGAESGEMQQLLEKVQTYAKGQLELESRSLQDSVKSQTSKNMQEVNERFTKLEARVLADAGKDEDEKPEIGGFRMTGKVADSQVLRKVGGRLQDFEAQMTAQMGSLQADLEKKISFLNTGLTAMPADGSRGQPGLEEMNQDVGALKYDIGELKDLITNTRSDAAHVKRIVLACERDMEDFTAAMDAVNVDLDEMRARVDSTHSIITSRQRVEATVTAEISTMRLDMGDMQEALKAHDAWMEDVSQSLQECHERASALGQDILNQRDQTQAKLDAKVDVVAQREAYAELDSATKIVNNMVSTLRLEVDDRRRTVDEGLTKTRQDHASLSDRVERHVSDLNGKIQEEDQVLHQRLNNYKDMHDTLNSAHDATADKLQKANENMGATRTLLEKNIQETEAAVRKELEDKRLELQEKADHLDRCQSTRFKQQGDRLEAIDLRIAGLQGACGESKRSETKMRDEVNQLMVKTSAHECEINKTGDDVKKLERLRAEDTQHHKQDLDAVYEELDQKLYEKSHTTLEDHVCKLARGVVKLSQIIGVFPGARMDDGTEEELDIDVELLSWEDCCQYMASRVDKMWKQHSAQKYKSMLDLLNKKADHSVLRLLQISQQHIESQLERVRHERELWKEVVDKRAQQPLQLALTLKDQNMQQLGGMGQRPGGPSGGGMGMPPPGQDGQGTKSPMQRTMNKPAPSAGKR